MFMEARPVNLVSETSPKHYVADIPTLTRNHFGQNETSECLVGKDTHTVKHVVHPIGLPEEKVTKSRSNNKAACPKNVQRYTLKLFP